MPDRENVIYDIERCICHVPDACRDCSHYTGTVGFVCMENLMSDVLALLKEQEYKDKMFHALEEDWKMLKEQEPVRCQDCKHRTRRVCNNLEFWECNHLRYENAKCGVTDDWFCADGERRPE